MALELAWTDPTTQIQVPTAYAKIVSIHVDAVAETVDILVGLYVTALARQDGSMPFGQYHAWPDYDTLLGQTIDVRAAAYGFLKTLDAFTGAIDA